MALAVLAALAAAGYTVWDKRAVGIIAPFTYFYSYSVLVAVAYAAYLGRAYSAAEHRTAWREHGWTIVQIGVFNTVTYLLVLFALRDGVSSYVVAIRQLSIAFGALLGRSVLGERLSRAHIAGIAAIVGGTLAVAFGR